MVLWFVVDKWLHCNQREFERITRHGFVQRLGISFLVFHKIRRFTVLMDEILNPLIDQLMGNMILHYSFQVVQDFFPSAGFGFPLACCACKKNMIKHDKMRLEQRLCIP